MATEHQSRTKAMLVNLAAQSSHGKDTTIITTTIAFKSLPYGWTNFLGSQKSNRDEVPSYQKRRSEWMSASQKKWRRKEYKGGLNAVLGICGSKDWHLSNRNPDFRDWKGERRRRRRKGDELEGVFEPARNPVMDCKSSSRWKDLCQSTCLGSDYEMKLSLVNICDEHRRLIEL